MNAVEGSNGDQLGADVPAASDDVSYLTRVLGSSFVNWVLADPATALTEGQLQVASQLAAVLRANISRQPELPVEHIIPLLASYNQASGTTLINYAYQLSGGVIPSAAEVPDDPLLSAFLAFGVECYGEMLLPAGPFRGIGPDFHNYARTQVGKALVEAIIAEGIFPSMPDTDYATVDSVAADYLRSTMPGHFAHGLISSSWKSATFQYGTPSLPQLLEHIPDVLAQLRTYLAGQPTAVPAIASFTGARLPEGTEVSGSWGRLRPARAEDHPPAVKHLADKRTTTTTEAGQIVEISDAGDIIFESTVHVQFQLSAEGSSWTGRTIESFDDVIDRVRLAFALAVTRQTRPVMFCMWMNALFPTGCLDPRPLTDTRYMAPRVPTLLTEEEAETWKRWIDVLMTADVSRLKVAITRTLRAVTERLDPQDRLIDAVIAWESLFGASNESTLRVSASLARMLHPGGDPRVAAQESYRKIYQARSDIVHANETKTTSGQIEEYGRSAVDASLQVLPLLLTTHSHLLSVKSSTRSILVLLGSEAADPSDSAGSQSSASG
jgi:hypothetical protein